MDLSSFVLTPIGLAACCYGGMSLVTFLLYGWDKAMAQKGKPRISERTLHLWTISGGFPGAIAGQLLFRHKTRKLAFVVSAWGSLAIHVAIWAWILGS